MRLVVEAPEWDYRPALGESIAVSGCCLTLAKEFDGTMRFDVVRETLTRTMLGGLGEGAAVNVERSLAVGDPLGGHMVQGHVDGVGAVERVQQGGDWRVWLRPPVELMRYMAPKGSVCLDGVSLTLAGVGAGSIEVALIPTTLEKTTLRQWKAGDRVNIEADVLAKTVVHYLEHFAQGAPKGGR
jgi:riboflavin synthase